MNSEKITSPPSGYLAFFLFVLLLVISSFCIWLTEPIVAVLALLIAFVLLLPGLIIVNQNDSKVLTLFGQYIGTVKKDGFFWVNPFTAKKSVSLKAYNLNGQQIKVNDKIGNPILVVLCGERNVAQVVNAGTLYH